MNCSSVIINIDEYKSASVIDKLKKSSLCEFHIHDKDKIIVTIEEESTEMEVAIVNEINRWDGVISAVIAYSYCEDNIKTLKDNVEIQADTPQVLNDATVNAENIKYGGNLKKVL